MDLTTWLTERGGIAHRADAAEHGYPPERVRAAIRSGRVLRLRAQWVALPDAPADLIAAAVSSARITCLTLARRRRWWIPEGASTHVHLHVAPNAHRLNTRAVLHWSTAIVDRGRVLTASVEDALAHIAHCLPAEDALTIWESALSVESLDVESLRMVRWRDPASRQLARRVQGRSGSGIETIFVVRLSSWGIPIRQQVRLAGHRVDVVIGTHLVIQLDGFAFHSRASARSRDVAHDAELRLRGYTVLRFTYAQIMHEWERVESTVAAAIARGLHLSPERRP